MAGEIESQHQPDRATTDNHDRDTSITVRHAALLRSSGHGDATLRPANRRRQLELPRLETLGHLRSQPGQFQPDGPRQAQSAPVVHHETDARDCQTLRLREPCCLSERRRATAGASAGCVQVRALVPPVVGKAYPVGARVVSLPPM